MRTHVDMTQPGLNQVFVFGSNLAGVHGAGAAKAAHKLYGAKWGCGEGLTGRCYALPTKDEQILTRTHIEVMKSVAIFITYVMSHPEKDFFITRVGCMLAGFKDSEIAPMFHMLKRAPNCDWPEEWAPYL